MMSMYFFYVKIIFFFKGGVFDKGYNLMFREELKFFIY